MGGVDADGAVGDGNALDVNLRDSRLGNRRFGYGYLTPGHWLDSPPFAVAKDAAPGVNRLRRGLYGSRSCDLATPPFAVAKDGAPGAEWRRLSHCNNSLLRREPSHRTKEPSRHCRRLHWGLACRRRIFGRCLTRLRLNFVCGECR